MILRRGALFALLMLLPVCAPAATVWTGLNYRVDASNPISVGINLRAVTLTIVGLNGALPNTFDGTSAGLSGITTAGNGLAQVFEFAAPAGSPTPTLALVNGANSVYYPIDSHFLVVPPAISSTVAPSETMLVANNTEAPFAGYGNSLTGQFVLQGAPPATFDFAYIVTQPGTTVNLNFKVADGGGQVDAETVFESFVVPEPGTLCLAAIAAFGFLFAAARRR